MIRRYFFLILSAALLLSSCKKEDESNDCDNQEFDRAAMLDNIAKNVILPCYSELASKTNVFDTSLSAFDTNSDSASLAMLKAAYCDLYKAYQSVSVFELGPAETELLRSSLNTFPTDTAQITANVSSGSYNLAAAANADAKGLPAIDYLLAGAPDSSLVSLFSTHGLASNRKKYLTDVFAEVKAKVTTVNNEWQSGTYLSSFISSTGTDIGSSIGLLVNQLNKDLELIKNAKIGIPLGKKTLNIPIPEKAEAYYKGISIELTLLNIKKLENVFLGRGTTGDGLGFDDYLAFLGATKSGSALDQEIKNQFALVITKLQAIPDPLSSTILNNSTLVDAAYVELQKLVVLLKTDMTSALGVQITYQDNDGD